MTAKFIIARTERDAERSATIDWLWTKARPQGYHDQAGDLVRYCASVDQLRGVERGAVIYLGYGWRDNRELDGLRVLARQRGFKFLDGDGDEVLL